MKVPSNSPENSSRLRSQAPLSNSVSQPPSEQDCSAPAEMSEQDCFNCTVTKRTTENNAITYSSPNHEFSRSRSGAGSTRQRTWNCKKLILLTVAAILFLSITQASAKGEMMAEDDFDSSNKKVKFEDFDTVC